MGINIGNNNKIVKSNIAEKIEVDEKNIKGKTFYERHPAICSFLISLAVGIILLFSFWKQIVVYIERLF